MAGVKVIATREEPHRRPFKTEACGSQVNASGAESIRRAAKRADWAGRALEHAAEDLQVAGAGDGVFDGLTEMVLDQAGRISRLAEDIESRRDDLEHRADS